MCYHKNMEENQFKKVVNQLEKRRKEMKLTYENISEISNVPYQTVYYMLKGQTNPHILNFEAVCKALKINLFETILKELKK